MRTVHYHSREHYRDKVFPGPFYSRQKALNVNREWSRWYDYLSVPAYSCSTTEYFAGRNACAVFDLTPMTKHRIGGPDALPFLNRLVTRDVARIKPGRVGYAVWCNDEGQVIDDGTIFHLREGDYRLCSQEHQIDWLMINALGFDVTIVEDTHDVAGLAVQGPTSCAVLKRMGLAGVENITPFGIDFFDFEGTELTVSRTGYTGDLGYELWIDPGHAEILWDRVFEAGELHNIRPMGSDALEMLRIEAGFILAAEDFMPAMQTVRPSHTRSPFELGLGWLVDFNKPLFNGRKALLTEKENGSRYALVKLDIEDNKPANHSYVFDMKEKNIGWVTSAMWSPSAKKNIALATVETPHGKVGEEMQVEIYYQRELKWSRIMARAKVVKDAFWDPPRRRQTPPADY
ncbi:MAG: aminomethyl transferase family protein [Xanthomonadales bacterium]|nr:aminomethyl transferase family protein [Xanthomonadales bacterium]